MLAYLPDKCGDSKHGMIERDHYMYVVDTDWNAKVCYSVLDCVLCVCYTRTKFVLYQRFR